MTNGYCAVAIHEAELISPVTLLLAPPSSKQSALPHRRHHMSRPARRHRDGRLPSGLGRRCCGSGVIGAGIGGAGSGAHVDRPSVRGAPSWPWSWQPSACLEARLVQSTVVLVNRQPRWRRGHCALPPRRAPAFPVIGFTIAGGKVVEMDILRIQTGSVGSICSAIEP